jgi:hypothetical protein
MLATTISVSQATITLDLGNGPASQGVNFTNGETGLTVVGQVGTNDVFFTSTEELAEVAGGQARIEAVDSNLDSLVEITIPGFGFTSIELNPRLARQADGPLSVLATGTVSGPNVFSVNLSNGENRFFLTAVGESILSVSLQAANGVNDFRQIRFSGIAEVPQGEPGEIPEPATLGLMSFATLGLGLLRVVKRS